MPGLPVPRIDCRNWEMTMSNERREARAPSDHLCASRILRAGKAERRMYRQVSAAVESGNPRRAQRLIRMYVLAFDVRLAALAAENKRQDWRRKRLASGEFGEDRSLPPTQVVALANQLNMLTPSAERVRLKPVAKQKGGVRIVCQFGLEQKARQRILRRVLMLLRAKLANCQFLLVGRPAALTRVVDEAVGRGHRFAAELDVTNQFGSFDEGAVTRFLPELPAKSVGANLVPTRMNFDRRKLSSIPEDHTRRRIMPRQGLPPGASTSPVVAEILMATVLMDLPWETLSHVTIVTYADNILVMGPTKASVDQTCECLSDAFSRSAVGYLRLESRGVKSLRSGVEFLGMKITQAGERTSMTVPWRKREALVRRLRRDWRQYGCANRLAAQARSYSAAEALDQAVSFAASIVTQALVSQDARAADLLALDRMARRSLLARGGLSLSAVMLDTPKGDEWRSIRKSLRESGFAA